MAAEQTILDFDWRDPINPSIANQPWPLENYPYVYDPKTNCDLAVKCYRNVIFIWLFHTPLLLNWIDDNHEQHGDFCPLCTLRTLARRFWDRNRDHDATFDQDVDKFWKETHNPGLIENLDDQNDAEEYMKSLIGYLHDSGVGQWAELMRVQKQCVKVCEKCKTRTQDAEEDYVLQGTFSGEDIEYQPLCRILKFNKLEEFGCKKCKRGRRHEVSCGLLDPPPILVIHCKPHLTRGPDTPVTKRPTYVLSGKVTRLEHSIAFSTYSNRSLDPKTIHWDFYHLYGVILRGGNDSSSGHYVCAFEQRQTGRWLFFNDFDETSHQVTTELTRSELDNKIDEMQKGTWRIFMLMYRRLFQVPVQQLTTVTFPSTAIALQNQQSQEESGEPGTEEPGEPDMEDVQEEYYTPEGESVGDGDLLGSESDSGQTRGETQGATNDELQGNPSDSETLNAQAEQSMPIEKPLEQNVEVEADSESSTAKPDTTKTGSRAKAEECVQKESQEKAENEEMAISQPASEIVRTEVEPSAQPRKTQAKGKATKRTRDKAMDEDEETSRSVPVSKRARTGVKSSTQPKKKETKSKTTKRARKDASDDHENEKTEISAPSTRRAKTVAEPSTGHGGRETRSRARAKRACGEIPDADKNENEQTATSKPPSKKAKAAKASAQFGKAQTKSKVQRKK